MFFVYVEANANSGSTNNNEILKSYNTIDIRSSVGRLKWTKELQAKLINIDLLSTL